MDETHDIMTEIKGHFTQCAIGNSWCSYTEVEVLNISDDHELLLTLCAGAFSELQMIDPSEQNFTEQNRLLGLLLM